MHLDQAYSKHRHLRDSDFNKFADIMVKEGWQFIRTAAIRFYDKARTLGESSLTLHDLETFALEGFVKALEIYDPGRSTSFVNMSRKYMKYRIHDGVRAAHMTPQHLVDKHKLFQVHSYTDTTLRQYPEFPPPSVGEKVDKKLLRDLLQKVFRKMKQKHVEVLRLYYWKDYNIREIGEKLGVSKQAVHSMKNTALKKVRALLQELSPKFYQDIC